MEHGVGLERRQTGCCDMKGEWKIGRETLTWNCGGRSMKKYKKRGGAKRLFDKTWGILFYIYINYMQYII